jgi:signal transduction histidine kinase
MHTTDRILPPLLRSYPRVTDAQEQAFDDYAAALTRQLGILAAAIISIFTVAWWPLDSLVMPDAATAAGFGALRGRALIVEVATLAVLALSRPRHGVSTLIAVVSYASLLGAFGYSLGALRQPDLAWLADAYLGVVPSAFIPMRLGWRLPATALIASALGAGFFVAFPANLDLVGASGQISFLVFAVLFTVAIGEFSTRVMRRAYFEARELAELSASLTGIVEERTSELRGLARHLDAVQERERARLARDLHDELGQHITAMRYTVARMEQRSERDPASLVPMVGDLSALLAGTSDAVGAMIGTMRPRIVHDLGLIAAAEWLVGQIGSSDALECSLDATDFARERAGALDSDTSMVLFRVLQEASTNARKHAGASMIDFSLFATDELFGVVVRDNGCGFDTAARRAGFGLIGLRERLADAGGVLQVESKLGAGTVVTATIPFASSAPAFDESTATRGRP